MTRRVVLAVALVAALLGGMFTWAVIRGPSVPGSPVLGRASPQFELPTLNGDDVRLSDLQGKAVIINFWNSWCIPCRQEHPALEAFYEAHQGEADFVMIGIVRDDSESAAREWVEDRGVSWIVAMDPGSHTALDYGTRGQPETFAINGEGIVVGKQLSRVSVDDLEILLAAARR